MHELAWGYLAESTAPFTFVLPLPSYLSVAGSREFDLVTCVIHVGLGSHIRFRVKEKRIMSRSNHVTCFQVTI